MGIKIYYILVAVVLVFGMLMPQEGKKRKYYIILMAILHAFVCGFRYKFLTGDLLKYAWNYTHLEGMAWTSEAVLNGGRNIGFGLLNKLLSTLTHGNFQILLIVIAVIIEIALAMLIYNYSPRPWMSYYVWNCICFFVFGFSAIKQALAMGFLMWAVTGILDRKPWRFLILTLIAGLIHMPAFAFLPVYWIAKRKVTIDTIVLAIIAVAVIFVFRKQIIDAIGPLYYDNESFVLHKNSPGLRFFFIAGLLAVGIAIKGFEERSFTIMFHLMIIAAIFQMFSGFDNVFTRMADYFFQFSVIYIPMLFYSTPEDIHQAQIEPHGGTGLITLNSKSKTIAVVVTVALLMLYYYRTQLSAKISYEVDNYLNFRFMWDVAQ